MKLNSILPILKDRRIQMGMFQKEAAQKLNGSPSVLSKMESGTCKVSLQLVSEYLKQTGLGVALEDLDQRQEI